MAQHHSAAQTGRGLRMGAYILPCCSTGERSSTPPFWLDEVEAETRRSCDKVEPRRWFLWQRFVQQSMTGYYVEPADRPNTDLAVGARAKQSRQIFPYPFVAAPSAVLASRPHPQSQQRILIHGRLKSDLECVGAFLVHVRASLDNRPDVL
ncbi:hypothetical protein FALCPG4_003135 [Fusarium falciforme]